MRAAKLGDVPDGLDAAQMEQYQESTRNPGGAGCGIASNNKCTAPFSN